MSETQEHHGAAILRSIARRAKILIDAAWEKDNTGKVSPYLNGLTGLFAEAVAVASFLDTELEVDGLVEEARKHQEPQRERGAMLLLEEAVERMTGIEQGQYQKFGHLVQEALRRLRAAESEAVKEPNSPSSFSDTKWPIKGTVCDKGGGVIEIAVDRDTPTYPSNGQGVIIYPEEPTLANPTGGGIAQLERDLEAKMAQDRETFITGALAVAKEFTSRNSYPQGSHEAVEALKAVRRLLEAAHG